MHSPLRGEDGAVAVLVAILLPVVLLGFGALVLDFGALYAEKRQLQNGADAGALAAAREYAPAGPGGCVVGAKNSLVDTYNDQNANDPSGSNIDSIQCPAANKVRVTTSSNSAEGAFIAPFLAQVLGAGPTTVRAVASAAWGTPSGLTSALPLTISYCEFKAATAGGYAIGPPYDPAREQVIHLAGTKKALPCPPKNASGQDLPGGFGWLDPDPGTCQASTNIGTTFIDVSTGKPMPSGASNTCSPGYFKGLLGQVVDLPIYEDAKGNGSTGGYEIRGYAAFFLTGYKLGGGPEFTIDSKSLAKAKLCNGEERCLYGYFTKDITPVAGSIGTGPNLGVTVVQLTE